MDRKKLASNIIKNAYLNKEGHIGSSLSILDALICLFDKILKDDDEFILSKGHASLGLYAVYLEKEYITEYEFFSFCKFDSKLGGHPSSQKIKKVKISTGSLGHGLPFSVGLALAKKIKGETGNIYCLIGDGEANEGTVWESVLLAGSLGLNNLICLMDFNGSGERAVRLNTCIDKFKAFNWETDSVNGHCSASIEATLQQKSNTPKFIELLTIKGKGCRIMESNPEWHHKSPSSEKELNEALENLYL